MNIEAEISKQGGARSSRNTSLLNIGSAGLDSYLQKADAINLSLENLARIGDETIVRAVRRLQRQLDNFEPSITMIGQVKAGKTSLVNAMVGWPNLLPADVNPWTSVVTSLHLDPNESSGQERALFKFFDENEWNRLLEKGGRIGELASRAGAEDELENIREQIEQMRERSRARLGKRFELLLGQEHDYGHIDQDLIERYVCLGDDFDDEDDDSSADTQGRFADITKSAELFIPIPEFKTRLCIRDTPGVNDTFMMREQITIGAIRDSRLCVVVLSAHQALSSVDMALIRLISNIKSRDVIIFVNRIDELSDPAKQVPEIRASIRATLKTHQGPADAQIVFGSAYWANKALSDSLGSLSNDSALSLVNWAEQELNYSPDAQSAAEMIWGLSGIPALYTALSDRIAQGVGRECIDKVARSALNLANGLHATNQVVSSHLSEVPLEPLNRAEIAARFDEIETRAMATLKNEFGTLSEGFNARVDRSHRSFLERATASLISHLEKFGENEVWQYDPAGLRVLLRSAYRIFGSRSLSTSRNIFETAATEICDIYACTFGTLGADFNIEAPRVPRVPPPVFLGQTIALDLNGSWWKNWWQRRRGYQVFAANFYDMIMEETDPIVNELKITQTEMIRNDAEAALGEFLTDQRTILMQAVEQADIGPDELKNLLQSHTHEDRKEVVQTTLTTLNQYVA